MPKRRQDRRRRPTGGENSAGGAGRLARRAPGREIDHAPGDRRRRVDKVDRPRRKPPQPVDDQRIVGAGEHHRVGAGRASQKQGAISAEIAASATGVPARSASA